MDNKFSTDGIVVKDIELREYGKAITMDSKSNIYVDRESFNFFINNRDIKSGEKEI